MAGERRCRSRSCAVMPSTCACRQPERLSPIPLSLALRLRRRAAPQRLFYGLDRLGDDASLRGLRLSLRLVLDAGILRGGRVNREQLQRRGSFVDDVMSRTLRDHDHVVGGNLRAAAVQDGAAVPLDEIGRLIGAMCLLANILTWLQAHEDNLDILVEIDLFLEEGVGLRQLHHVLVERCHVELLETRAALVA